MEAAIIYVLLRSTRRIMLSRLMVRGRSKPSTNTWMSKSELAVSLLLTVLIAILHFVFLMHAGALWRDEVQILNISTAPTFSQQWEWNEHDTFPLLWQFTLRAWNVVGFGQTDFGLRVLGCLVGLGVLGMLWYCLRQFRVSPLICLPLFALNPIVLVYGDTIRGYGFGILWMLFMIARLAILLREPTNRNIGLAALSVVLAVQSFYFSVVVFTAVGGVCLMILLYRRAWRTAIALFALGCFAALTMLPYIDVLRRQAQWFSFLAMRMDIRWYWDRFSVAANTAGVFMKWVWIAAAALALSGCVLQLTLRRQKSEHRQNQSVFIAGMIVVGTVAYFGFLLWRRNVTQDWYYIALMAFVAVGIEVGYSEFVGSHWLGRAGRLASAAVLFLAVFSSAWTAAHVRMTNVDLLADQLKQRAQKDDLIVVNPWWPGVTFMRYYQGDASWSTLPDLGPLPVQRFDILKQKIAHPKPIQSVLDKVATTLQSGHRLWIVGGLAALKPGEIPEELPVAETGFAEQTYLDSWSRQMAYLLDSHARSGEQISVASNTVVSRYEDLPLFVVSGWH